MSKIKYSIIIPTWLHLEECLKPCCQSIIENTNFEDVEVLVVANGCGNDGTREYVESLGAPFRLIWMEEQGGYVKPVNEGIKQSKGDYIILLNNDTKILPMGEKNSWLDILNRPFTEQEKVGITGPMKTFSPSANAHFLIFFCVMISREVINTIGMLDEEFFAYGEDTHMCLEAEKAGFRIVQVPEENDRYYADKRMVGRFPIWHEGNVSFKNWPGGEDLLAKNNTLLEERWNKALTKKEVQTPLDDLDMMDALISQQHSVEEKISTVDISKALLCDGYMTDLELTYLAERAKESNVFIEVGSWHGKSTRAIADNLPEDGILYAVDHWRGSAVERDTFHQSAAWEDGDHAYLEFCENLWDHIQSGKVIPVRLASKNAAKFFYNHGIKANTLFIDAGHTYPEVKEDIDLWLPLVENGGILCGHDYYHEGGIWDGVRKAVDEKFGNKGRNMGYIEGNSIWAHQIGNITKTDTIIKYENPLRQYFDNHNTGKGIWKWEHYLDVYHRYCEKFIGKNVNFLEVGVYAGGSLDMMNSYFGPQSKIYGVDIQYECMKHNYKNTSIYIGDQGDKEFWKNFKNEVKSLDVVIDDGSHIAEDQIVTFDELFPFLNPGGIYICEDVHGVGSKFVTHVIKMADKLNSVINVPNSYQKQIESIHFYPYMVVIEKAKEIIKLNSIRKGDIWALGDESFSENGDVILPLNKPIKDDNRIKIYDCFPFLNELDVLEIRFEELYNIVDRFIISEAHITHSGKPKPLFFNNNLERFEKYLDKVTYIVVEDMPNGPNDDSWSRERHQRDSCMKALTDCKENDIIIIGDADEIPTVSSINAYKILNTLDTYALEQDLFYYFLNSKADQKWDWCKLTSYQTLKKDTACGVRYTPFTDRLRVLKNGGWHFSYIGGIDAIIEKIGASAHVEYDKPELTNKERITELVYSGKDVFNRGFEYKYVKIDETFPLLVKEKKDIFKQEGLIYYK